MFTRATTTPGTSPSSISWSMRANVIVNSYAEKVTFAKFAYTPAICSGSRWMLSWRSWGSSSTTQRYYGRGPRLQLPPLRLRGHGDGDRARHRHRRFPGVAPRRVAAVLLPRRRLELADGARHGAPERLRAHPDHLPRARGDQYLCVHRLARRRGDRARGHRRSLGRAEEAKDDRRAARPLHHLRLRTRRPARGRRIPARGGPLRRARL